MTNILEDGIKEYGLELPEAAAPAFRRYFERLEEKNKVVNLTAISGETDVYTHHFLDSLFLLTLLDFNNKRVIDVGSGAGFPGLPLKIAIPGISLTLLDSQRKRIDFLTELCTELRISGAECVNARAEEAAFKKEMRGKYDIAVSRAVAKLNVLCELCMPFVKQGGYFIAMKGVDSGPELAEAENAIGKLGGRLERAVDYFIPGTNIPHRAALILKTGETPSGYPRRFAKIQKNPL